MRGTQRRRRSPTRTNARSEAHSFAFEHGVSALFNLESLRSLGFSQFFVSQFMALDDASLAPARVVADSRGHYELVGERHYHGTLSGRLRHELAEEALPITGDWVAVEPHDNDHAIIHHALERHTSLRRKSAGTTGDAQVIAANVDVFFIVTTATSELNPRRVERFLSAVSSGGAEPVVVLNKVDLVQDREPMLATLREVTRVATPIVAVSAREGSGLDALAPWIAPSRTIGFVGSSGVGKASLINALLGRGAQHASHVADDGRGRHTTTGRALLPLPNGAWLMDTPGMREFGAIDDDPAALAHVFADIEALASQCRFRDCRHNDEPGCAVIAAVAAGALSASRVESMHKLAREARAAAARHDHAAAAAEKRKWKAIARGQRAMQRSRNRDD